MIEIIRDAIAQRLRGYSDFAGVEIITRREGDPESRALELLGKNGVCVVVSIPSAMPKSTQGAGVELNPINILVAAGENVPVNQDSATGSGRGAMYLAERAVAVLKFWVPPLPTGAAGDVIMPEPPGIEEAPPMKDKPNLYIVRAHFTTRCTIPPRSN